MKLLDSMEKLFFGGYVDESYEEYEEEEKELYENKEKSVDAAADRPQKVHIGAFGREDLRDYIRGQCEIMEDAGRHAENAMEEYSIVTERFSDIELFESAPDNLKQEISETAESVDNLAVDRRILKNSESKLSNNAYNRMEMYEEEIIGDFKFIQQQETYYETVKRDLSMLEGERMGLRMEVKGLRKKLRNIRKASMLVLICLVLVYSIFTIAMVALDDEENIFLFFIVTFLGAVMALGIFALLKNTQRRAAATEVKLNKTTAVLNKIKIKYVNAANVLSYVYDKYKIKSSYELGRKYELYLEMKDERQRALRITSSLNDAQNHLLELLGRLGMQDANIWLSQTKGLYNRSEMVEIRHELTVRRQKLRTQIEYNETRIEDAKDNIRRATKIRPEFTDEVVEILDEYEKRSM